jgi:hypothetical protein
VPGGHRFGQLAVVHLRRDLVRDQLVIDEGADALLEGACLGGELVGHGEHPPGAGALTEPPDNDF